ncbi:hypothetical protein RclHR1_00610008 [Rhizophagus clarus]|uniref:Kinase-like domain-containing protein n=1 Tax=Rhizophagus clarus TaxID=94130 RepID=A0A2Z6RQN9_9GLOM|nr:hypothetical protein RclHR1_00610008 [Rhizophagus clarus]GES75963.1 kinase-like domain-containing protein [Rhizophagus clarus]
MNTNEVPLINVPYPPELTVEEILNRRSDEKLGSRAPNQFLIYRQAYIKELRKGINGTISMKKISSNISASWSRESSEVKEAYRRLSNQVESQLRKLRHDNLVIVYEMNSSPSPSSIGNDNTTTVDEPTFFYPYYYDYNYFYYDYYNYFYFY